MRQIWLVAVGLLAAIWAISACPSRAASQQLSCSLNSPGGAPPARKEPVTVLFDDSARTLRAQRAGRSYSFADVSISNVAISGDAGAVSLGIDRSSLGLVWQQYDTDKVRTEYGQCLQNSASSAVR